jgi:hypothetical protein
MLYRPMIERYIMSLRGLCSIAEHPERKHRRNMTKIKLKYAIPELGGALYEVKLNLPRQEEMTEKKRPRKKHPRKPKANATEAQLAQRQRFALAMEYARAAMANPNLRALYQEMATQEGKSAFAKARADYFQGKDLLSSQGKLTPARA